MKKTAAFVLMMAMCLACACAQALTMTGLETESVVRSWEHNLFFQRMEALTGVAMEATGVTDEADYDQMIAQMAAGEKKTDVLFKADLTRAEEKMLLDSGAVLDLAPMIDEHMPNLSALLAAHPEWKKIIALEDGRIASLPQLNEKERQVILWINRAWLDKLGLAMPTTLEELTAALLAMKGFDFNGNHDDDEVAADLLGVYEMRWLLPYFGIVADDYHLARGVAGELVFAPELPAYRDFIALLADWFAQGILPKKAFSNVHSSAVLAEAEERPVASGMLLSVTPYTHVPAASVADFEPLLLAGPDGAVRWRDLLGAVWTGCFAVSSGCSDVPAALKWADALYAEEGAVLGYAGAEGEDYEYTDEGYWAFITNTGRDINAIRAEVLMYTGTAMPGLYPADFIHQVDSPLDRHVFEASERVRAVSEQVTLPFCLSDADQAKANELCTALTTLVDCGIARFVTGEVEFTDENYDAWIAEMQAAGSAELAALFTAAE